MTRDIVTTHYRYKRLPRKRAKAAEIEGPAIVTRASKRVAKVEPGAAPGATGSEATPAAPAANDERKAAIVTIRRRGKRFADVPEMTPEEHQRRGDAADALFQEMKRRITEKDRS